MRVISIMLVDDHPSVLNGLQMMLSSYPLLKLESIHNSAASLLDAINLSTPDVIIMDIKMPGTNGLELCKQIKRLHKDTIKIIALTSCEEKYYLKNMLQNGAAGYLLKSADKEVIIEAIETVYKGETYIHRELRNLMDNEIITGRRQSTNVNALTKREKEILKLIVAGHSNQEISSILFLSIRTIENHRFNLMQKLDVKNVAGLIQTAINGNLIN